MGLGGAPRAGGPAPPPVAGPRERPLARHEKGRADRRRAGEEVFVRRVAEGGEGGHVAGLGGTRLQQAGELGSGCHVRRLPRGESHRGVTRPSRCSTIAPATSLDVASCKPRHPGIPLTSTTYVVPSRAGRRSTPA